MMIRSFGAAIGLALCCGLTMPVRAEPHATLCQTADGLKQQADDGTAAHGGAALRLDGNEAVRFLDYVNHIGDPTDFHADTVIIGILPDLGYALVAFVTHGCADSRQMVRIDLGSAAKAYRFARGSPS